MREKIIQYLEQIQQEKDIEILLACETGSRAWGFPSPDSDYDVRFIYKHKPDWYLSLNEKKDTIERMFENNEFDLSGWDIKKSLGLLWKSNPPLLERIQSPIIYMANDEFVKEINGLAKSSYSKIATMHHYLSMAKKIFSEVADQDDIKLKKLFYLLRTSVACKWIMEKDEIPPIIFPTMLDNLQIENGVRQKIYSLIELKSGKGEANMHHKEPGLLAFVDRILQDAENVANKLPVSNGRIEDLNTFFRKLILA